MGLAKQIEIQPITKKDADQIVKKIHYSGKVDPRSQLHFGVFYQGQCHGAMQFGPSIDKSKTITLVKNTRWNGFIELNRMAFADTLPKNSESRALGVAFKIIKKNYPHIKWCVSFADGTQCGDGTIYRASGFMLTQIKQNRSMWRMPDGEVVCQLSFTIGGSTKLRRRYDMRPTETFGAFAKRVGATCLPGYQLRYVKLLDEAVRNDINFQQIPFEKIRELGIGMYRGQRASSVESGTSAIQAERGGESPTDAHHLSDTETPNIIDAS
jgi:hypothetical protein